MSVGTAEDRRLQAEPAPRLAAPSVTVTLLGGFSVRAGTQTIGARGLGGGKPRQVFEILALHAGTAVSKTQLIAMLWPDRPPTNAPAALESYVSVLRQHLLAVCDSRTSIVRTTVAGYLIERDRLVLDVDRFQRLVTDAEHAPPREAYRLLREALDLADVPLLLEDTACSWADDARRLHSQRVNDALVGAADAASSLGYTQQALELAERALAVEPHSEAAWIARLTALERAGRHADALRVYAECRSTFAAELGCAPGPSVQRVVRRLLSGTADSDDELADLLVALVRVRDYAEGARPAPVKTSPAPGPRRPSTISPAVREAYQLLEDLLERARRFPVTEDEHPSTG
jgi:SARP family transcriptional regulator, regulator of embCAB operon